MKGKLSSGSDESFPNPTTYELATGDYDLRVRLKGVEGRFEKVLKNVSVQTSGHVGRTVDFDLDNSGD